MTTTETMTMTITAWEGQGQDPRLEVIDTPVALKTWARMPRTTLMPTLETSQILDSEMQQPMQPRQKEEGDKSILCVCVDGLNCEFVTVSLLLSF